MPPLSASLSRSSISNPWPPNMRLILVPLVVIELVLVAVPFFTNNLFQEHGLRIANMVAEQELSHLVQREASQISQALASVTQLTLLYQGQAERALRTPYYPEEAEVSRYQSAPDGSWYTVSDNGGAAGYYKGAAPISEAQRRQAWQLAQLDPLMAGIHAINPLVVQISLTTKGAFSRFYPYFDVLEQPEKNKAIKGLYSFYSDFRSHRSNQGPVWTKTSLDPVGRGWITSCVAPVYQNSVLEAVVGLEMSVKAAVTPILAQALPWRRYGLLVSKTGQVLAMAPRTMAILGIENGKQGSMIKDPLNLKNIELRHLPALADLATWLAHQPNGMVRVAIAETSWATWTTLTETGWRLVLLIPETDIPLQSGRGEIRTQRLSLFIPPILVGGYLLFLAMLVVRWRPAEHLSARQLEPIEPRASGIEGVSDRLPSPPPEKAETLPADQGHLDPEVVPGPAALSDSDQFLESPILDPLALADIRAIQRPGGADLLGQVIDLYLESGPSLLAAMSDALQGQDPHALSDAAHSLKSASANLGAERLAALCKRIENQSRSGRFTEMQRVLQQVEAEYQRVCTALEQERHHPS